jgi:hypothetical protein
VDRLVPKHKTSRISKRRILPHPLTRKEEAISGLASHLFTPSTTMTLTTHNIGTRKQLRRQTNAEDQSSPYMKRFIPPTAVATRKWTTRAPERSLFIHPQVFNICQHLASKPMENPAKHVMVQGRYCWQHEWQEHKSSTPTGLNFTGKNNSSNPCSPKSSNHCHAVSPKREQKQNSTKANKRSGCTFETSFRITQKGTPCKRCIAQGGYCFQHLVQKLQ